MQTVAVLAFPGVVAFDLAIPCHAFGLAGDEIRVCGDGQVGAGAFDVVAPHALAAALTADTLVVPGLEDETDVPEPVVDVLRAATGRLVSICTGAFALAEAGVLDGRRATTHWRHAADLQARFPRIRVEPDVLYVDEGEVLTSAGVAAGLDLCLHLIARDRGAAVANRVARRMVVAPQRAGGQAQFVETPIRPSPDGGLGPTRAWLLERLDEPLTVADMAHHAGYSPRTFARRFRAETGTTPLAWLLAERVRAARRALEDSDAPVEHIAQQCGFGTSAGFREHFRRALRTTPSAYRAAFRASSMSVRVAKPEPPLAV